MINPILNNRRYFLGYFYAWAIIAICQVVILTFFYKTEIVSSVADAIIFNLIFSGLGLSIWYVVKYSKPGRTYFSLQLTHIATASIYILIWMLASYFILYLLFDKTAYMDLLVSSIPVRVVVGLIYYILVVLVYYVMIYYQTLSEKIVKESELKALINKAELDNLKSQLNPHFIFNSLNSISSLTMSHPSKAQEMIIKLSSFLRYSLDQPQKHQTLLSDEISNAKLYLDIEKVRFGDKLLIDIETDPAADKCTIPAMILQPIFENAIKHGVYESTEPITIKVRCNVEPDVLIVKVANNFDPDTVASKRKGIGLLNIKNRLKLVYGNDNLLSVNKQNNKFEVILYIPQTQ